MALRRGKAWVHGSLLVLHHLGKAIGGTLTHHEHLHARHPSGMLEPAHPEQLLAISAQ